MILINIRVLESEGFSCAQTLVDTAQPTFTYDMTQMGTPAGIRGQL